jgi:hypothetical protein
VSEPPAPRKYFSERQGRGPRVKPLPFEAVKGLAVSILEGFRERGYLQEAFGIECVDGDISGTLGAKPSLYFLRAILRDEIWPYWEQQADRQEGSVTFYFFWQRWDDDTLFDVIEVIHDLISKPVEGEYHAYNECGWHYKTFNRTEGQEQYRLEMNEVLRLNDPPYELDTEGQIIEAAPVEFSQLLDAPVPEGTEHDRITSRIDSAVTRFRTRGVSIDDRRHAVRDLADVLEALRPDIRDNMLRADEKSLFELANRFSLRHYDRQQRGDYDRVIWLRWAFYVYLATIHAVLRVRQRASDSD